MSRWDEFEAVLRERAYRTIDADPQVLLEGDGGPVGQTAHIILARLIGYDDEIVRDGLRLPRVEPVLLLPIAPRLTVVADDDPSPMLRTARYNLQSGFARLNVAAEYAPADVQPGPDFLVSVLYVRYRRRG